MQVACLRVCACACAHVCVHAFCVVYVYTGKQSLLKLMLTAFFPANMTPPLDSLVEQGLANSFSMCAGNSAAGVFVLGGIDPTLYNGKLDTLFRTHTLTLMHTHAHMANSLACVRTTLVF